jgi:hypothetical protein
MKIDLTGAKLPGLAARLVAGVLLLLAAGASHAAPQLAGAGVMPLEPFVHSAAKRDHRSGGSKTASSAQGGVLVGGKETKVRRPPSCGRGCSLYGQALKAGTIRDHRPPTSPRGQFGRGGK